MLLLFLNGQGQTVPIKKIRPLEQDVTLSTFRNEFQSITPQSYIFLERNPKITKLSIVYYFISKVVFCAHRHRYIYYPYLDSKCFFSLYFYHLFFVGPLNMNVGRFIHLIKAKLDFGKH
jgi:hypothetical protein